MPRRNSYDDYQDFDQDNPYDDGLVDEYDARYDGDYFQGRYQRRRNGYRARNGNGNGNGQRIRGLYDADGNAVDLVISSPRDMLPPHRRATELNGDWNIVRSRARF